MRTQVGALVEGDDGTLRLKLRESPFYAAGGGQVSDHGVIESEAGRAVVEQVVRQEDDQQIVARLEHGTLSAGELTVPCTAPSSSIVVFADLGIGFAGSVPNVIVCGVTGSWLPHSTVSPA